MEDRSEVITKTFDLVRAAQDGSAEASNRLVERYYERVRSIVRLRLGDKLRRSVDSGDVLQQTFIAAVQRFDRFEMRDESSMINWLAKLAENQITDLADYHGAKKRSAGRQVSIDGTKGDDEGSGPIGIDVPDGHTRPLEKAAKGEDQTLVEACLAELPEKYRELIILRDYTGASWKDIAKKTGSPSDAAARMKHAKAMLELSKLLKKRGLGN